MTVGELALYISLAIVLQLALFSALAFFRYWRSHRNFERQFAGFESRRAEATTALEAPLTAARAAAWSGYRDFQVVRKVVEDKCRSVCSLHLTPEDRGALPAFMPGQFLTIQLNVTDSSTGKVGEVVRCYSLSDGPGLDHYRISVKRIPPPAGSADLPPGLASGFLHDFVQEGDILAVRAPAGHFFLEPGDGPVVLIAGGIGITPMLSMLNATLARENPREIWLFYGVRNGAEHVMKAHLEMLAERYPNFRLHVCYSQPSPGDVRGRDYRHEGYVDITLLRQMLPLKPFHFYVCGPRAMMEALVPALDAWGVPEANIHYEAFGPASLSPSLRRRTAGVEGEAVSGLVPVMVTFRRSGVSSTWDTDAESLLEFAERNGIRVPSGCRAGSCGSCQTAIEAGAVEYSQRPDFDPEPGCCLLCISRPVRDLVLLA